ncbi:SH3 domain-containing protein [Calothrix sp. PCC 7507]|uniref:SH3 domain-containing protein n=1 Tax=Calothrix sp. PCC 7507 TaxID=99598 RepID=UPI00029F1E18|nr:SH3 domain-containing protein [Calothrix sp. PCC 7507]AFY31837.1 SH3 type 3 domain protein [Calothrix sp. PCC 7507]
MFKALLAGALILTAILPAAAEEVGPGVGGRNYTSAEGYNAHVCTNESDGSLSVRTGPGKGNRKILELSNRTNISVLDRRNGRDGFVWFRVRKGEVTGWVRSDYICDGSLSFRGGD